MEELEETAWLFLLLQDWNPRTLTPAQVAELVARFPKMDDDPENKQGET